MNYLNLNLNKRQKKNKVDSLAVFEEAAAASSSALKKTHDRTWRPPPKEYVELGTIRYANLTPDGRHGDYKTALEVASNTGKPIFANFVEWSG